MTGKCIVSKYTWKTRYQVLPREPGIFFHKRFISNGTTPSIGNRKYKPFFMLIKPKNPGELGKILSKEESQLLCQLRILHEQKFPP
jgi:hypothetical protein